MNSTLAGRSLFSYIFSPLPLLLAAIFSGAIVGETVSLSLAVSAWGPEVISLLFLIDGLMLFFLPLFFFKIIDFIGRGKLLTIELFTAIIILPFFFLFIKLPFSGFFLKYTFVALYVFAYLSKTILFLTFWTLASDIYETGESKKHFPVIAAVGLSGGLIGACTARVLLELTSAEMMVFLWIACYVISMLFSIRISRDYFEQLSARESLPGKRKLFFETKQIFELKIIRLMGFLYFLVFLTVFCLDYLFWKRAHAHFSTPQSLVSFQFTFYLFHSIVSIACLLIAVPRLIERFGFSRLFYLLPAVIAGGGGILFLSILFKLDNVAIFPLALFVQFLRQVAFENAFSPIYQMFFAGVTRDKRGRARTALEGTVKPVAIVVSGILIFLLAKNSASLIGFIVVGGLALLLTVDIIRKSYFQGLTENKDFDEYSKSIISQIGSILDRKTMALLIEYSHSEREDLRLIAVELLAKTGSDQALDSIDEIYKRESQPVVRERIALVIDSFYQYRARYFFERLFADSNLRVRANALQSINKLNCQWKRHCVASVKILMEEKNLRVKVAAAQFLWNHGMPQERIEISIFLDSLLSSTLPHRKSAGIYLLGQLQPEAWYETVLENIESSSFQVYRMSIDVIFKYGSLETKKLALILIDTLSRDHISIAGRIICSLGTTLQKAISGILPSINSRRMFFELVKCLRHMADEVRSKGGEWILDSHVEEFIRNWITKELMQLYNNALVRSRLPSESASFELLDYSLRDEIRRVGEWTVNVMVLMDKKGIMTWKRTDVDLFDETQLPVVLEILPASSEKKIAMILSPLLQEKSFDSLANDGKRLLEKDDICDENEISYFLKSTNKWVVLCSLYSIYLNLKESNNESTIVVPEHHFYDKYPHLAEAAQGVTTLKNREQKVEAFELLERVLFFKKMVFFQNIPGEKLMHLAEISHLVEFKKDDLISKQGEISETLYIIKSGWVRIEIEQNNVKTVFARIGPGETYGEIGLFGKAPRSASAIAEKDCTLFLIRRGPLKKLVMETPEIANNFLEFFSERLRANGAIIANLNGILAQSSIDSPLFEIPKIF